VNAVVAEVSDSSVMLDCFVAGTTMLVRFPASIVPSELKWFGAPVSVFLSTQGGYRIPVVEARTPTGDLTPLPGERDVDEWLNNL
jgi:hypothetical protein